MNPAKNGAGVTVQTMNPVYGRGQVYYASLPETPKGHGTNGEETKHRLVSILWDHLATLENTLRQGRQSSNRAAFPIRVLRGTLGRPYFMVGDCQGPAISFSEWGGTLWAALSGDESDIGIDVAGADEFRREYPFQRVFHPEELQHALKLAGGDLEQASALLWSAKEAVVKALGCAFHLVDPLQISVYPSTGEVAGGNGGYTFPVGLSGKALMRFPTVVGRSLRVHSLSQRKMWLSIALLDCRPTVDE